MLVTAVIERWPVDGQFVIARGSKSHVDVLVVAVSCMGMSAMGEGTPVYYRGESAGSCLAQIEAIGDALEQSHPREARLAIQQMLAPGAARNALDCALWNLEAKLADKPLWQLMGLKEPKPLKTAFTISLGEPEAMEADAADAASSGYQILKLKLTGEGDRERVAAVHRGAPEARLIVDANESWGDLDIAREAKFLSSQGVEMIEQPLPDGQDSGLIKFRSPEPAAKQSKVEGRFSAAKRPSTGSGLRTILPIPVIADESCHDAGDVPRLASLYDGINIKLDKAGGLTEAMEIAEAAKAHELTIMVGCMLSTSMAIVPAFLLAQRADWVDLDGPALLERDRDDRFRFADGMIWRAHD